MRLILFCLSICFCTSTIFGKEKQDNLNTLIDSAQSYVDNGDYKKAIDVFKQASEIAKKQNDTEQLVRCIWLVGTNYFMLDDFESAKEQYVSALNIALANKYPVLTSNIYRDFGTLLLYKSNLDSALIFYTKAYELIKSDTTNRKKLAIIYGQMAYVYEDKGDFNKAIEYHQKAIRIKESSSNKVSLADSYIGLGTIYARKGNLTKSFELTFKALHLLKKDLRDRHPSIAIAYQNIGDDYFKSGDYSKALEYVQLALDISIENFGEVHHQISSIYGELANIYSAKENWDKALIYNTKELEIDRKIFGDNSPNVGRDYSMVGICYAEKKEYNKALECYNKSTALLIKNYGEGFIDLAVNYDNIADLYRKKGDFVAALTFANKSLEIYKSTYDNKNIKLADCYYKIANIYYEYKKYNEALQNIYSFFKIAENNFKERSILSNPKIENLKLSPHALDALTLKAEILSKCDTITNHLELALQTYQLALEYTNKCLVFYTDNVSKSELLLQLDNLDSSATTVAYSLYTSTGKQSYLDNFFNIVEQTKAMILLSSLNEHRAKEMAHIPKNSIEIEDSLKREISAYERLIGEEDNLSNKDKIKLWKEELLTLKSNYSQFLSQLEKNYPEYYNLKYKTTFTSINYIKKNILDKNSAYIEYAFTGSNLYIFAVTDSETVLKKMNLDSSFMHNIQMIRNYVSDISYSLNNPKKAYKEFCIAANAIYLTLFPLEVKKIIANKTDLILVPDDILNYLSFDLLLTNPADLENRNYKNLSYLIKKYSISYGYSASVLEQDYTKENSAEKEYLGFAPSYNNSLFAESNKLESFSSFRSSPTELKANKEEVVQANEIYSGTIYLDDNAKEEYFKSYAKDYNIIHLAMHALIDDSIPLNSKLLFSNEGDSTTDDEFLNVYELYNTTLNANLAILSACNTGNGKLIKGEGVSSLARAFRYAGCPSMVMSLWKADDLSTSKIMIDFLKQLKMGKSKSRAIREAKLNFLSNSDQLTSNPYYWADFVVIGNNTSIKTNWSLPYILLSVLLLVILTIVFFKFNKR